MHRTASPQETGILRKTRVGPLEAPPVGQSARGGCSGESGPTPDSGSRATVPGAVHSTASPETAAPAPVGAGRQRGAPAWARRRLQGAPVTAAPRLDPGLRRWVAQRRHTGRTGALRLHLSDTPQVTFYCLPEMKKQILGWIRALEALLHVLSGIHAAVPPALGMGRAPASLLQFLIGSRTLGRV